MYSDWIEVSLITWISSRDIPFGRPRWNTFFTKKFTRQISSRIPGWGMPLKYIMMMQTYNTKTYSHEQWTNISWTSAWSFKYQYTAFLNLSDGWRKRIDKYRYKVDLFANLILFIKRFIKNIKIQISIKIKLFWWLLAKKFTWPYCKAILVFIYRYFFITLIDNRYYYNDIDISIFYLYRILSALVRGRKKEPDSLTP